MARRTDRARLLVSEASRKMAHSLDMQSSQWIGYKLDRHNGMPVQREYRVIITGPVDHLKYLDEVDKIPDRISEVAIDVATLQSYLSMINSTKEVGDKRVSKSQFDAHKTAIIKHINYKIALQSALGAHLSAHQKIAGAVYRQEISEKAAKMLSEKEGMIVMLHWLTKKILRAGKDGLGKGWITLSENEQDLLDASSDIMLEKLERAFDDFDPADAFSRYLRLENPDDSSILGIDDMAVRDFSVKDVHHLSAIDIMSMDGRKLKSLPLGEKIDYLRAVRSRVYKAIEEIVDASLADAREVSASERKKT